MSSQPSSLRKNIVEITVTLDVFFPAFNGIKSAVLCFNFADCSSKCNFSPTQIKFDDVSLTMKNFVLSVSWPVATLSGVKTMFFTIF